MAHPYKSKASDGRDVAAKRYAEGGGITDQDRKNADDALRKATRWRVDRYGDLSGAQGKLASHISNMVPRRGLHDDGLDIPRKASGGRLDRAPRKAGGGGLKLPRMPMKKLKSMELKPLKLKKMKGL